MVLLKGFHSSFFCFSKRNGVIIVKKLSFVNLKQRKDKEGIATCIEDLINGVKTVLCNIYALIRETLVFPMMSIQ